MLVCGTCPARRALSHFAPTLSPFQKGSPKVWLLVWQNWGKMTFSDLVASHALRSSWQKVQVVGVTFLFHSHRAYCSQNLIHPCWLKAQGDAAPGTGVIFRRARAGGREEGGGGTKRKRRLCLCIIGKDLKLEKKIPRSLRNKIVLKKCLSV